ncbi:MAG: hypothetical protein JSV16_00170, partial [Candidatus Hydrogenedentota bacterium]
SEAIHCHHRPESAGKAFELARLVHLADKFTHEFMELKGAGTPVTDISSAEGDVFPPEKKAEVFIKLERRVKNSTLGSVLT